MSTRAKLTVFINAGFMAVLAGGRITTLPLYWRSGLILLGGWGMAVGSLYQVKLYGEQKDILYYIMVVFAVSLWLGMLAITGFWVGTLFGIV